MRLREFLMTKYPLTKEIRMTKDKCTGSSFVIRHS